MKLSIARSLRAAHRDLHESLRMAIEASAEVVDPARPSWSNVPTIRG